ncbi:MAG: hypothetical protein AB7E80_10170 [Hyphomicrobiaceae bacterium]
MTKTGKDQFDDAARDGLAHVLEVHGADRDRWPASERLRLAPVLAASGEARRMVSEAAALERLLDLAPRIDEVRAARLARDIVARAEADEPRDDMHRGLTYSGPIRSAPHGRARGRVATRRPGALRHPVPAAASVLRLPAAAMLAASLVLGAFIGANMSWTAEPQEIAGVADTMLEAGDNPLLLDDELLDVAAEEAVL